MTVAAKLVGNDDDGSCADPKLSQLVDLTGQKVDRTLANEGAQISAEVRIERDRVTDMGIVDCALRHGGLHWGDDAEERTAATSSQEWSSMTLTVSVSVPPGYAQW